MLVQPPQVVDQAAVALAHQVARAVHAPARCKWIGNEAFGAHARALVVAPRQAFTAQVQLPADAHRQRVEVGVEHIQASPGHTAPDRRIGRVAGFADLGTPQQRRDHGFGRAIAVDQALRAQGALDLLETGFRHGIAAEAIHLDRGRIAQAFRNFGHLLQVCRREAGDGDAMTLQHFQGLFRGPQIVITDHQAATGQQHTQPALLRTVESERHEVQLPAARCQFIELDDATAMPGNRSPRHGHAFGLARGTGGVNQVRQVPRQRMGNRARHVVGNAQLIQQQTWRAVGQGQSIPQVAVTQQQAGCRIAQQVRQSFGRVRQVQRQVSSPRLEHREERDDGAFGTRQRHRHQGLRPNTANDQLLRQPIGLSLKFGVTDLSILTDQGDFLRLGFDVLIERLQQISGVV